MHSHTCTSRKRTRGLFTVGKVTEITFTKMNGLVYIYICDRILYKKCTKLDCYRNTDQFSSMMVNK